MLHFFFPHAGVTFLFHHHFHHHCCFSHRRHRNHVTSYSLNQYYGSPLWWITDTTTPTLWSVCPIWQPSGESVARGRSVMTSRWPWNLFLQKTIRYYLSWCLDTHSQTQTSVSTPTYTEADNLIATRWGHWLSTDCMDVVFLVVLVGNQVWMRCWRRINCSLNELKTTLYSLSWDYLHWNMKPAESQTLWHGCT